MHTIGTTYPFRIYHNHEGTKIRISPRNPKSNWGKINKQNIARLQKEGLLQPSGKAMVHLAKRTSTWNALTDVDNLVVPTELKIELEKYKLLEKWNQLSASIRRMHLESLFNAKKLETKHKRISAIITGLQH